MCREMAQVWATNEANVVFYGTSSFRTLDALLENIEMHLVTQTEKGWSVCSYMHSK